MSSRLKSSVLAAFATAALALSGAACATMHTYSYLERGVDLRQYRTFNWGPADTWSTGDPRLDNNRFFDERVRARVEKELSRRGFEKTTSGQPDLVVHYHAYVSQEVDIRQVDGTSTYCTTHDCAPFIFDKGTLFVDLVEPKTDKVLWRGWAEGSLDGVVDNQSWMESKIDETVAKILTRLPSRM